MRKYGICLFLLSVLNFTHAQPLNKVTVPVMIETAERAMASYNYYKALEWYEKAYESSEDLALVVKIADLHYALRDVEKAEKYYAKLYHKVAGAELPDRRFEYARALKMNGKYAEAIEQLENLRSSTQDQRIKALAEAELTGAQYAQNATAADRLTISNAGSTINTKSSEYSPFLLNEGKEMYFASFGENEIVELDRGKKADYGAKILVSQKGEKGWGEPVALDQQINRPGYFTSNLSLSPDGQQLFFARQLLSEGNKLQESKLYTSSKDGANWGAAREVEQVNGEFLVKSPALGELFGEKVLFFVSDKSEGYGDYDIYYATMTGENTYSRPVNLGAVINTVGQEESPFFQNGTLYFSSTGHPGMGGYDIFKSEWNGSEWSKPVNLGPGYNSSVDDLSFMLDASGANGLLTSNRIAEGARSLKSKTCCNDIYTLSIKQVEVDLLASAENAKTQEALTGTRIRLFVLDDGVPELLGAQVKTAAAPLAFDLYPEKAYRLIATTEGFFPDTIDFNTVGLEESLTIEKMLRLHPVPVPPKEEYVTITREEPFTLENIYYDYDAADIREDAEPDLRLVFSLLKEHPTMIIELSSHTDSRGNAPYNLDLSQRRAESARQWLLTKGITAERVVARGYGEASPKKVDEKLATKHTFLPQGTVLTEGYINALSTEDQKEIARQINRRTEIKIIDGPTSIRIEEKRLIKQK